MPRRSKLAREAATQALADFQARQTPIQPAAPPGRQMDIVLTRDGTPVLFTWYRGHRFEGWISQLAFDRMERDGVLSWDRDGKPVIDETKARPPTIDSGPAWIGSGI